MRIERGEHMSYPPKFEDIEARPPRLSSRWRAGMAVGPRTNSQVQLKKGKGNNLNMLIVLT
jgi:hypothetical protein